MTRFLPDSLNSDGTRGKLFMNEDSPLSIPLHLLETAVNHNNGGECLIYSDEELEVMTCQLEAEYQLSVLINFKKYEVVAVATISEAKSIVSCAREILPKAKSACPVKIGNIIQFYHVVTKMPFDSTLL